jgi:hypothetical protein
MLIHLSVPLRIFFILWKKLGDSSDPLAIQPMCLSSLGVMLRFLFSLWKLRLFVFSIIVKVTLSISATVSNPLPVVNFPYDLSSSHWKIPRYSSSPLEKTINGF